jgi:hypothetical protein
MEERGISLPNPSSDGPSLLDYSPVVARLDLLADRVMAVRTAVLANYTKDHQEPQFEPLERPVTALDREREVRTRSLLLELDALVFGDGLALSGG